MNEHSAGPLAVARDLAPLVVVGFLFVAPVAYAMVMTIRNSQTFQSGRSIMHIMVVGLVLAALVVGGLFALIMGMLNELGGLHN
jgi:hypothetical protein